MKLNDEMVHAMTCEALNYVYGNYSREELNNLGRDEVVDAMGWPRCDETLDMAEAAIEIAIDLRS